MSWYADIHGEIETSLEAKPVVMEVIGKWAQPEAEGQVQLTEDQEKGVLTISFNDLYRNLGRFIELEVYKIAQKFPQKTKGNFVMYSTDGDFVAAEYRIEDGKLFCRALSEQEEEIVPHEVKLMKGPSLIVMVRKSALDE